MSNDDSSITYNAKGDAVTFVGPDAVSLYRAAVIRSSIGLLAKGITPTRGLTSKKAFALATEITKKPYKRGEHQKAMDDLKLWCDTMKAALPSHTQE